MFLIVILFINFFKYFFYVLKKKITLIKKKLCFLLFLRTLQIFFYLSCHDPSITSNMQINHYNLENLWKIKSYKFPPFHLIIMHNLLNLFIEIVAINIHLA